MKSPTEDEDSIADQIKLGAAPDHAYLHVGKTAGSSVRDFIFGIRRDGYQAPIYLGHDWGHEKLIKRPDIRIHLVLRDPLERTISGFNSRLRRGQPTYNSPWSTDEAVSFGFFPKVEALLDAVLSDDISNQGKAEFAFRSISHLKRGYEYYFGGQQQMGPMVERLGVVGMFPDVEGFIRRLSEFCDVPESAMQQHYAIKHQAATGGSDVLSNYSESQIARLQEYLQVEYAIFKRLSTHD